MFSSRRWFWIYAVIYHVTQSIHLCLYSEGGNGLSPPHCLIPLSNTRFWIVWLNLFMQVQVVGGWTSHRKSQDTQGARFLLLLGSAGSLLLGLFLFQTLLPCSFTAVKREPCLLNLPALSLTALEVTTSTERMSRWCPGTRFYRMDSCLFVFTP